MLLQIILSITVVLPAVLVLSNRRTGSREWLFFLLSLFLSGWVFSNFLIDYDIDRALFWSRTTFFCVVWASYFFYEFTLNFPKKLKVSNKLRLLFLLVTVFVAIITYSSLFIPSVAVENNIVVVVPGSLYGAFLVYYPAALFIAFLNLWKGHKNSKGIDKAKAGTVMLAFLSMSVVTSTTNLILPVFFEYNTLAPYGGYATIIFTFGIAYSMLRHHLFDIRSVAARTIGYVGSILVIVASYALVATFVTNYITSQESAQSIENVVFVVFIGLSALLSKPIKAFFDKYTNKLFFRDAYDPQALLDDLNKTLVSSVDIEALLTKSSLIIQENLKTNYCTFYIRETSYFPSRIIGAHRKNPEITKIDRLQEIAPKIRKKIFNSESSTKNPDEIELLNILKENQFEIMIRLVNTLDYELNGIGFIFIGSKRSGVPFTKQDFRILEIIANELVIATENVLRLEEIQQFNVTLQKKIDDATKELKQNNDKLRALDEAKDEFVSMASHQLRTPLTSIKGYLSMVLEGDAGDITDTQKKMLGQAFFSSQRMVYLISDLLNVSRLKTGKFVIETKPVYLPDIVESELDQLYEGANAKNLKLTFSKPKTFSKLILDEMKLRQVIMNFTDNAIYYTPSGGKINVELKETDKSVEFTVKDSGIGVPKDQQHKLFTKFYRADNARKARPDGTGLGLFMAKKVIIAQGGSMIFESKEGKGSTFGFTFPKDKLEVKDNEKE